MQWNRYDKLNQQQKATLQVTNEEWFKEFPLDADIRAEYCNNLEDMLYDYMESCKQDKREIAYNGLFLVFLTWLVEISNSEFKGTRNALEELESTYNFSTEELSDKFAKMIEQSEDTKAFNNSLTDEEVEEEEETETEDEENNGDLLPLALLLAVRARTIARTETNKLCNYMMHEQCKKLYHKHTWVTERDNRVRETHRQADRQTVDINEPFIVNGYEMMYPCDSSLGAPPEEIVNCRCHEEFSEPII